VSRAYAEAIRRGYLQGEVGRGTYVRRTGPIPVQQVQAGMARSSSGPIDFTLNLPAAGEGAAALAKSLETLQGSQSLAAYLDYQTEVEAPRHAEAAAAWLRNLGLDIENDGVILTNGAQHGLLVSLLATARPGDVLLTETMTYGPIKAMARHLGLKLRPLAMDDGGLSPAALDAACRESAAKVLYCLPTLQTPTTITMTEARRHEIAAIAKKHELLIIEDDVFGFLPPERPAPLACHAPDNTVFLTSTSKCLAPGLRVGFLYAPPRLRRPLRAAVNLSCWMPPPLMAEIASSWIIDGTADKLNQFQRSEAQARQEMARRILAGHDVRADPHGFHLWLSLPQHWWAESFRAAAERQGVKVLTGETFVINQAKAPNAIRLCLSHEPSRARVSRGLEIIAGLLDETGDAGGLVV
ncbi:MAG: PLP-dependent aminotransferase family protein, partial [Alphaproteobacteria bacterium]|nr:PLP-dependent aminotransferase family protein [Alphaproteobacteria bacterium]